MLSINNFIIEKLKINSKSKISKVRYLSKQDMGSEFLQNFQCKNSEDLDEIERDIDLQKETPQQLIDKITYKEQLFCYWFYSVIKNWEEGYDIFRQEIINRKYATEDELDACIIDMLDVYKNNEKVQNYLLNYLDKYDVKIK